MTPDASGIFDPNIGWIMQLQGCNLITLRVILQMLWVRYRALGMIATQCHQQQ